MSGSDDDTSPAQSLNVLEGWLEKHGDWLGQWNRRWFRLQGRVLSYKLDPAQPDKGSCHLHGLRTENKGQHIRVWTETSDSWLLRAQDAETHAKWLEAIKIAVLANENRVVSAPRNMLRSDSVGSSLDGGSTDGEVRPSGRMRRSHSKTRSSRGVSPTDPLRGSMVRSELLRASVKKRSAWLHKWNQRFVVVDGVDMVYSEKEDGALRGRHTITAIDPTEDVTDVKISTSNGEEFHLRFDAADLAKQWVTTIRASLQSTMMLRWQAVTTACKDGSSVYLRAANHAATLYDRDGAEHVSLIMFGGMSSTLPASAKAEERAILCSELLMVKMSGDHDCVKLNVKAFQEGPGAFVKPASREGHASTFAQGRFYIFGGANKSAVLGDLWYVELAESANLQWIRVSNPNMLPALLPPRCGHAMVNVDDDLWIVGGFDGQGNAVADVFSYDPATNTVVAMPSLPQPRARHACAPNATGSVLCVGGTASRGSDEPCNRGFLLKRGDQAWVEVQWDGAALPKMVAPNLVACGRKGWLLIGSDGVTPVQVYFLQPSRKQVNTVTVEHLNCAGDCPRMHHGLSAHRVGDYVYVAGDSSLPPIGPAVRRLLLPPSMSKHAPPIPTMGSASSLAELHDSVDPASA